MPDHPYHYPIIGYKHDLWSLKRESLVHFYKEHYVPNNATLIIVGDVDPDNALLLAQKEFGHIAADKNYKKSEYYHRADLKTQSVTLYRDIKSPLIILSWVIPGAKTGNDYLTDIVSWILGSGKGSRLHKKLVDEMQLVTDFETFTYDLFDHGMFFMYLQPKEISDLEAIITIINNELLILAKELVTDSELMRAIKRTEVEQLHLLESNQKQAYAIGKFFLALGDENYVYTYTQNPKDHLAFQIREFIKAYLRPSLMHKGAVLPLIGEERAYWQQLQAISDQEDKKILDARERTQTIEQGKCVVDIQVRSPKPFNFEKAKIIHLNNGLKVLYSSQDNLAKIDLIVEFVAKHDYDPVGKEGLSGCVAHLLLEGTKHYSAQLFIDTLESYGMTIHSSPGSIMLSMLAQDFSKGLELLNEILVNASFSPEAVDKVKAQMVADLDEFWDNPARFAVQLARQEIYKTHPASKSSLGTIEGVKNITREDVVQFYKKYYTPQGTRIAVVGALAGYDIPHLLEEKLGRWHGPAVEPLDYPILAPIKQHLLTYPILRDQTVLCYAGLSVSRNDDDYDALLLFDQVFTGDILNSMASRLFDLREQSGLFYTIGGSLLARVDTYKGLILIKTIVSNDRLEEAQKAIEHVINTAIDTLTDDELQEARQVVVNSLIDNFSSYAQMAATFLYKDKFDLPDDYFDKRAAKLASLSKDDVQRVVKKYLNTKAMVTICVGRV